jgi:hypothetical protein
MLCQLRCGLDEKIKHMGVWDTVDANMVEPNAKQISAVHASALCRFISL